jgi:hypothetical protein
MRLTSLFIPLAMSVGIGCGGSGTHATGAEGGSTTASSSTGSAMTTGTGGMVAGGIPDPGTGDGVDNNFGDVEPNNTPQQATPLGVGMAAGVYVWVSANTIGGSDTADYFVFRTGAMPGPFSFDICYMAPTTGMTATLWKVVSGTQQMPPVGTWMGTTMGAQGCVLDTSAAPMLEASTEYLFGLTATGGAGMYSA